MKKRCLNPLCGSMNLTLANLTGYTDLVCQDCGQTVEEDVYGQMALENAEMTEWMFRQESEVDLDFSFFECETCWLIWTDEVYQTEPLPDIHGPIFCCRRCTNVISLTQAEPDEYYNDEPNWEDLSNDA